MAVIPKPGSVSFAHTVTKDKPYEWGFGSTPRIAALRDALYWKAAVVKDWIDALVVQGKCSFREGANIRIDMDRARIVTKAYRQTEGQPWIIRQAKALEMLCEEMPIFIKPGELIIGDPNGSPGEIRWYPERCVDYMPAAVSAGGGFEDMVTDDERQEIIEDIYEYWKDKCVDDRIKTELPEEVWAYVQNQPGISLQLWSMGRGGAQYDWDSLFMGLKPRIELAEARLKELNANAGKMNPGEYLEKKHNWEAMAMAGRSILRFAERYAELAREQSKAEQDAGRRKELEELAAILDWVPANQPRTFHECIQSYWIIEVVGRFLQAGNQGCGARIDQFWWPYYEADMKADRITRGKALELVECLFLKIQEVGAQIEWPVTFAAVSGAEVFYTPDLCGTTADGRDASNDLSCIIMEALSNVRVNQPPLAIRYHRNINPEVVERGIDLLRTGGGHPSWFNEDLFEKWGLLRGYSPEDARNTQIAGCVANFVMGKPHGTVALIEIGAVAGPKLMEFVLFEGKDAFGIGDCHETVKRPRTKNPRKMTSADEVLDAWAEHLRFYVEMGNVSWNVGHQVLMEYLPTPCDSFLFDEPLERGIEVSKLHKEYDTWPNILVPGLMNVSDSLAAMQKLVFDEKKYTMDELVTAIHANWAGYEEMRQDFLNAPKYGNDDDYADEWMTKLRLRLDEETKKYCDAWGNTWTTDGSIAAGYQIIGFGCGATPDGRHNSEWLGDGSVSPMSGADKQGPTAVLNSVGKTPFTATQLFNQRFMPVFLEEDNRSLFAEYLRAWYDKGTIPHIQFNVVDGTVLREAQENPKAHTDLQVRVAGYSAFFIDLPKDTQESIIARTEQSFC